MKEMFRVNNLIRDIACVSNHKTILVNSDYTIMKFASDNGINSVANSYSLVHILIEKVTYNEER